MLPKLGRYETLRKIASGGMATVYLGRVVGEGGFERLVALKLMHPHIASDPDFVAMFLDEARLAAKIRHPNVVSTIDIQKTTNSLFIVMEYVDGPTLQEIRKHLKARNEQIPIGVTVRVFIDILNGLQDAHDLEDGAGDPLNLVHRDVSPHNILIGTDGVAKLTDFGVAKAEARISSTRGGQLKGKIAYMPPEQILTEPVTRRADVYSAGVCLWEALVGKRLFRAANDGAMVHMILEGQASRPSKYVDDVPKEIEEVVMRAVSRRQDARYPEALDMADALEDAARAAGIRIPRQREVGGFIKEVKQTLGDASPSLQSVTPVSGSDSMPTAETEKDGVSQPSMPSIGTGPSHPIPPTPEQQGPPPIPDIGSDMNMPQLARGVPMRRASSSPPTRVSSPHGPPLQEPPPSKAAIAPRMSFPRSDELDDEATTVMPREMQEALHNSAPSQVTSPTSPSQVTSPTSPTHTEATYTLQPQQSRGGVIAVVVAGIFLLGVLVAVALGGPEDETLPEPEPATTGSPLFPGSEDPATLNGDGGDDGAKPAVTGDTPGDTAPKPTQPIKPNTAKTPPPPPPTAKPEKPEPLDKPKPVYPKRPPKPKPKEKPTDPTRTL